MKWLISTSKIARMKTRIPATLFIYVPSLALQNILIALFWFIECLNAAKIGALFKKSESETV